VLGVYVHVPFCTVRCTYCDFYLVAGGAPGGEAYAEAVAGEIASVGGALRGRAADTVHFGGGTPSLLPDRALARILETLGAVFPRAEGAEIALEANPEDITPARLAAWASLGFDRIAIGVQSLDDRMLRRLGRPHDAAGALRAVAAARRSPLRSVAADVMLGLPGEDPARTHADLARLVDAGVDHLSLYLLEVHPRTRLGRALALGRLAACPDDRAADLYEAAAAFLAAAGFEHYEISNFARPGHRSRHNQKYWTDADYLGFGPSAHSYVDGRRFANAPDLRGYLRRGGAGVARVDEPEAPARRGAEALIAGLRLAEGVDLGALRGRHGAGVPGPSDPAVRAMIDAGFLQAEGGRLRLTPRGRLVSNEVFERLIS
jgi:oxygen-independent coproporphyrinogen-3 oxidase